MVAVGVGEPAVLTEADIVIANFKGLDLPAVKALFS
jgi:hypothetical protein